ncbi:hypothetical protein ZIOFF_072063 [Zingiber officinale]|uniref:Uncharacterized protein n=1 Tax=Zingiber officinale TaxID=94328 RepID=A0A8J5CCD7_ZINOF|nr:hypothetical protein ZIOFF_072063 [Zingiber officinale]
MLKRTTSYLFATIDNMLELVGASKAAFAITKVAENDDSAKRYEREVMEFGTAASAGVMFVIIGTTTLINLACLVVGLQRAVADQSLGGLLIQNVVCGLVVALNLPIYEAMFLRKDEGRMKSSTVLASAGLTLLETDVPSKPRSTAGGERICFKEIAPRMPRSARPVGLFVRPTDFSARSRFALSLSARPGRSLRQLARPSCFPICRSVLQTYPAALLTWSSALHFTETSPTGRLRLSAQVFSTDK